MYFKIILAFVGLFMFNCISEPKDFEFGEVTDNVYTNYFFNMKMNIPEGWVYQDDFESTYLKEHDIFEVELEGSFASFPTNEIEDATLLMMNKYDGTVQMESNPNIILRAENLYNSSIYDIDSYIKASKKELATLDDFRVLSTASIIKKIGGQTFKGIDYSFSYQGMAFTQTFYTTIKNDFSFSITLTYYSKVEKQELEKHLEGIVFDESFSRENYN